jgi:predicted HAD superfamily phosphohydrolase YqeG
MVAKDAGEECDEQRVQKPDQRSAEVGAVIRVGDQLLVDVVAGAVPQEGEVDVLVLGGKVVDRLLTSQLRPSRTQDQNESPE